MCTSTRFLTVIVIIGLLCGCATSQDHSCPPVSRLKRASAVSDQDHRRIHALERQVQERDKQIIELRAQLESIRLIDSDASANRKRKLSSLDSLR